MIILRGFFDDYTMKCARLDVTAALATIDEWANPAAKSVHDRQGGLRLSDIDSPAIGKMARKLEKKIGLASDLSRSSAREQAPTGVHALDWHQDYAGMELKPGQHGMVAWVPLDRIDATRPGLEVAPVTAAPTPHYRDERRFLVSFVPVDHPDALVIDSLPLGDVVLLNPYEPHRTHRTPAMTQSRLSLDMRFL